MNEVVTALFYALVVLPFFSLMSTIYLARLVRFSIAPPVLLVLLVIEASVSLVCSSFISALTINVRFLGRTNPPELLPLTLLALLAPLAMINVIAFVLWRSQRRS